MVGVYGVEHVKFQTLNFYSKQKQTYFDHATRQLLILKWSLADSLLSRVHIRSLSSRIIVVNGKRQYCVTIRKKYHNHKCVSLQRVEEDSVMRAVTQGSLSFLDSVLNGAKHRTGLVSSQELFSLNNYHAGKLHRLSE